MHFHVAQGYATCILLHTMYIHYFRTDIVRVVVWWKEHTTYLVLMLQSPWTVSHFCVIQKCVYPISFSHSV